MSELVGAYIESPHLIPDNAVLHSIVRDDKLEIARS